jgi:hypothetical protein
MQQGYAYFVDKPRTINDLMQPHRVEAEQSFHITKTIQLSGIDYTNFITDMLVDRRYIEENYRLCSSSGSVIQCLLIKQRGKKGGILVAPIRSWVATAALYPDY